MKRCSIAEVLHTAVIASEVEVCGWVRTRRDSKDFSFLEVNDGSCLKNLQVVADRQLPDFEQNVAAAYTGASVIVRGTVVESLGKGQRVEVKVSEFVLVGAADPESYPLQKKRHSNEFLRTIGHLRPRTNTFGAVFRVRNAAAFAVHKFFQEHGFLYLNTPIITGSDCEGAGAMFSVTAFDIEELLRREQEEKSIDWNRDFFGSRASLTVSGQLEAELFASALSKVYTFGPTFRAENSNTPRHLAEFWMIEPEAAFCDLEGDMTLAEDFLKYIVRQVLENCSEDMEFFDTWIEKGVRASLQKIAEASFARITYTEAIAALQKSGKNFEFAPEWGADLQTEHERFLSEEYIAGPVFVTNYPKEIKAFYMRLDDDERTVAAMDLLVPRLGEIIGGSQREERETVLRRRLAETGLREEDYWWYLDIRKFGTVPHSGFGLGFERLLMYLTGMNNIRDVIPFPRTPGNLQF